MRKRILITGSTDGIGRQTAIRLARMGHEIILHGKNNQVGIELRDLIRNEIKGSSVEFVRADFTSFSDIEGMVEILVTNKLIPDVLINNAGVYQEKYEEVTSKNIEKTFMVNHMAGFYLTWLLHELMMERGFPVISNVSSMVHARHIEMNELVNPKDYNGEMAYSLSKLCNILFTKKMASMHKKNMSINCLHPGVIDTKLFRAGWGGGGSDVNAGADQLIYAALEVPANITGEYFEHSNIASPAPIAYNQDVQQELWDLSMSLMPPIG